MLVELKRIITEKLFGKIAEPVCPRPQPGWHTNYHGGYTNFGDWCKQFSVSSMHDRKPIYLD